MSTSASERVSTRGSTLNDNNEPQSSRSVSPVSSLDGSIGDRVTTQMLNGGPTPVVRTGSRTASMAAPQASRANSLASSGRQNTPSTPSGSRPSIKQNFRRLRSEPISWWWWWEIGGAVLSMISMLLIIIILAKVSDKPLENWRLPIQPNSLIAACTTVGKTAMMVPITSCLSQLKWEHFHWRPHTLDRLQVFDEASLGPWGSFVMLYSVRFQALLASAFALITLVSLGIDTSAQQILGFPQKSVVMPNISAVVSVADTYRSKALRRGATGTFPHFIPHL